MNPTAHPSVEELAALRDGLLSADAARGVSDHLRDCDSCAAELAAIDEVAAVLADVGATAEPMPADVARALDQALARADAEREAGVPSLAERRKPGAAAAGPRRPRWVGAAAAATAVVVLGGVGFQVLNGGTSGQQDSSASRSAADVAAANRAAPGGKGEGSESGSSAGDAPGKQSKATLQPQRVSKRDFAAYARRLADQGAQPSRLPSRCRSLDSAPGAVSSKVRFQGTISFVVLRPASHEAAVYRCSRPPVQLYSTPY